MTLTSEGVTLEATIQKLAVDDFSEVLDFQTEANQLELELDRQEPDLDDVSDETETVEQRIAAENNVVAECDDLLDELEACPRRIDQKEADAVDTFNSRMDATLDVLGYHNSTGSGSNALNRPSARATRKSSKRFSHFTSFGALKIRQRTRTRLTTSPNPNEKSQDRFSR